MDIDVSAFIRYANLRKYSEEIKLKIDGYLDKKADKVTDASVGNFAAFDSTGNIVDSGHSHNTYLTEETDPTVPAWAKQPTKPTYSYSEITNTPALAEVATSGDYNDLFNKPALKPVATSGSYNDLTNKITAGTNILIDSNNKISAIDTIYDDTSIKASINNEITARANADTTLLANIDKKQDILVSGTNIKTINEQSLLGSGDMSITTFSAIGPITNTTIASWLNNFSLTVKPSAGSAYLTNISKCSDLPLPFGTTGGGEAFIYVPVANYKDNVSIVYVIEITSTNMFNGGGYKNDVPGKWIGIYQYETGGTPSGWRMPFKGVMTTPVQYIENIGYKYIPVIDSDGVSKYYLDQQLNNEITSRTADISTLQNNINAESSARIADVSTLQNKINEKQDILSAGEGIDISTNNISIKNINTTTLTTATIDGNEESLYKEITSDLTLSYATPTKNGVRNISLIIKNTGTTACNIILPNNVHRMFESLLLPIGKIAEVVSTYSTVFGWVVNGGVEI